VSGRIASDVLAYAPEDLTAAELLVLTALALDAREKDRTARFSDVETLTTLTRLKPGTIRNALSTLAARALIVPTVDRVYRGGRHQEYLVAKLTPEHRDAVHRGRP
jgi:hypothetical protein